MKRTQGKKPLTLTRETIRDLRTLSDQDLRRAPGAGIFLESWFWCSNGCSKECTTIQ